MLCGRRQWGGVAVGLVAVASLKVLDLGYWDACFKELVYLVYISARYWHEGIPLSFAGRDLLYFLATQSGSRLFAAEMAGSGELGRRVLAPLLPDDDHATAVCKASMYTEMVSGLFEQAPGTHNLDTMDPVSTQERVAAYIDACREVYQGLEAGGAQRGTLDGLVPRVGPNVTSPTRPRVDRETLEAGYIERWRIANSRDDLSPRWKPAADLGPRAHWYVANAYRPVRERLIAPAGIPEAVRQGTVALFNATELLPRGLLNLTLPEIAGMHGEAAKRIPVYRQMGASAPGRSGFESLHDYAVRIEKWEQAGILRYPENKPWGAAGFTAEDTRVQQHSEREPTWWLSALASVVSRLLGLSSPMGSSYAGFRKTTLQGTVNTKRLTQLPEIDFGKALGNPGWLERTWSMLWMGPVEDCLHFDDTDNLVVAVLGEIYLTVFEQQDSDALRAGGDRGCWSPLKMLPPTFAAPGAVANDEWVKKYPSIHLKLEPGFGAVIPSGSWHTVAAPDGHRILLNAFLMPRYKGLWDAPAARHSFYRPERQTEEYAALRHLKSSTLYRLWDTKKLGGWFDTHKLEFF